MTELTKEQREALNADLTALDAAANRIKVAREPLDTALSAIEGVRAGLLERHGVEVAGRCDAPLLEGDLGWRDAESSVLFCAEHSPTYADWKKAVEDQPGAYDTEDERAAAAQQIADHFAAGGKPTDTVPLFPL